MTSRSSLVEGRHAEWRYGEDKVRRKYASLQDSQRIGFNNCERFLPMPRSMYVQTNIDVSICDTGQIGGALCGQSAFPGKSVWRTFESEVICSLPPSATYCKSAGLSLSQVLSHFQIPSAPVCANPKWFLLKGSCSFSHVSKHAN